MNYVSIHDSNKLDNTNYESWKIEMRSLLRINDLWSYVNGLEPRTEENHVAWREKDEKALDLIILNIKKNQYIHIKNAETSQQAWESLKNLYESQAPMRQYTLLAQLFRMRKCTDRNMAEYLEDYANKIEKMEKAGMVLPPNVYILMLMLSLPADYESFCIAIQSRDKLPTFDELRSKLLEEDARRLNQHQKSADVVQADQNLAKEQTLISGTGNQQNKRPIDQHRHATDKCHTCGRALKTKKDSKREKIPRTE